MRLGRPSLVLALVAAGLTGCGLFDTGSTVEDAFEYLPADAFNVRFIDRALMAERLGVDDIDPRDISDDDLDDYLEALDDERDDVLARTELTSHLEMMRDAPINDADVEWQAYAAWGEDPADPSGEVFAWKVGDDVDFEALADDLEDKGYDKVGSAELPVYSVDPGAVDRANTIGRVYPAVMASVLLDEDEQLVVASYSPEPLGDVADVIADDSDSLADDGGMDDLLEATEEDAELAWLTNAGPSLCAKTPPPLPDEFRTEYDDLGRPSARALFVSGDDSSALLALQFDSEDEAKDDLSARETLVEHGVDGQLQPFDGLGDFDLRRDGSLVLVEADFDDGLKRALDVEATGGGPGFCLADD